MNFRFPEYIDHIVTDTRGTALVRRGSFEQVLFTTVDLVARRHLSDHCPIAAIETDAVTPAAGDPIADLLARIDEVQAELQAIREAVSELRE